MKTYLLGKKILSAVIAGSVCGAAPNMVFAEDGSGYAIEEVIIYARKRAESLQDVPISITSVGSTELESLGAKQLSDLTAVIPNVQIGDALEPEITMRGVSTNARTIGLESGVGVYIDGVFVSRAATNADLAAVERVEVLRGPQGSLFGKNTVAGAVNIITKAPADEFAGSVTANLGNYGRKDVRAYLEGALTETTNGRLSLSSLKSDGHYTNTTTGRDIGGNDSMEVRADLVVDATDNLSARFSMDYRKIRTSPATNHPQLAPNTETASELEGLLSDFGIDSADVPLGSYEIAQDADYIRNADIWGASATVDYTLPDDHTLTSITARRSTYKDQPISHDDDNLPINLLNSGQEDRQLFTSQEFRITSPGGQTVDWLAGLYYDKQDLSSARTSVISDRLLDYRFGVAEELTAVAGPKVQTESYALYTNLDYHFTDDLTLTLGGRYTQEEKSADYSLLGACLSIAPICVYPQLDVDLQYKDSSFDPSASLSYHVTDDITTYFRAATGYKSGGFNVDFITPSELQVPGQTYYYNTLHTGETSQTSFDKEEVTSFELGAKISLLDRRLVVNAAVFEMEYTGFQVSRYNGVGFYVDNAGAATLRGMEFDFIAQLTPQLRAVGGGGYLDTHFDAYATATSDGSPLSLEGNEFPYAPQLNTNLALEYNKGMGDYGSITLRGEYTFKSDTYTSPENIAAEHVASQELFNGRISWFNGDESLSVSLWGKNLKDTQYVTGQLLSSTFPGVVSGRLNTPRTFGLEMNLIF